MPNKLARMLQASKTGNLRASRSPISLVEILEETPANYANKHRHEYKFDITLYTRGYVTEIEDLEPLKKQVLERFTQELYGDYRKPILDAILHIHQDNTIEAIDILKGVLDDMFDV